MATRPRRSTTQIAAGTTVGGVEIVATASDGGSTRRSARWSARAATITISLRHLLDAHPGRSGHLARPDRVFSSPEERISMSLQEQICYTFPPFGRMVRPSVLLNHNLFIQALEGHNIRIVGDMQQQLC